jgi:ATP-dependent Clp protease adapter protein ClpS
MNTYTPVAPVNKNKDETTKPEMWNVVMHTDPTTFDRTRWATAMHVIVDHMGVEEQAARLAVGLASNTGRAVVKVTTKDLAATLIESIKDCMAMAFTERLSFKMEVL